MECSLATQSIACMFSTYVCPMKPWDTFSLAATNGCLIGEISVLIDLAPNRKGHFAIVHNYVGSRFKLV